MSRIIFDTLKRDFYISFMSTIEERLEKIEERNKKVEADKAWEVSFSRKVVVAGLTYLVICIFFITIDLPRPWVNAIVPTLGFVLSTLSLRYFKRLWVTRWYHNK